MWLFGLIECIFLFYHACQVQFMLCRQKLKNNLLHDASPELTSLTAAAAANSLPLKPLPSPRTPPPHHPPSPPHTATQSRRVKELWEQPGAAVNLHLASHVSQQLSIFSSSITAEAFCFSLLLLAVSSLFCPPSSFCTLRNQTRKPCPQMVAFLTAPATDGSAWCWCPASLAAGAKQLSFCSGLKIHPARIKILTNTAGWFNIFTKPRWRGEYVIIMYQITGVMILWKTAAGVVPESYMLLYFILNCCSLLRFI